MCCANGGGARSSRQVGEGLRLSWGGDRACGPRGRGPGPAGLEDCMLEGLGGRGPGAHGVLGFPDGDPRSGSRLWRGPGLRGGEWRPRRKPGAGPAGPSEAAAQVGLSGPFRVSFGGDFLSSLRPAGLCKSQNPGLRPKRWNLRTSGVPRGPRMRRACLRTQSLNWEGWGLGRRR